MNTLPWPIFGPLNEHGRLLVGVKMENPRAAANCEEVISVPGIAFGEWGLGDMALCYGHTQRPTFPLPKRISPQSEKKFGQRVTAMDGPFWVYDDTNIKQNIDKKHAYDTLLQSKARRHR